jgi:hypothetical protein
MTRSHIDTAYMTNRWNTIRDIFHKSHDGNKKWKKNYKMDKSIDVQPTTWNGGDTFVQLEVKYQLRNMTFNLGDKK